MRLIIMWIMLFTYYDQSGKAFSGCLKLRNIIYMSISEYFKLGSL